MQDQNGQSNKNQGHSNTELSFYSEEVQEVMGRMPTWMERSGNLLLLMLVGIGLIAAWMIHYPDSIQSSAKIIPGQAAVSLRPPAKLVVQKITASNKQAVQAGAPVLNGRSPEGRELALDAPENGILHFLITIQAGDTLYPEQPYAALAPAGQSPYAVAYLNETQFNQVDLGQKVLIKTGESQQLFGGKLSGKVNRKSITPIKGYYEIRIALDETYKPILTPEPASATIILEDHRLIHRILHL